MSDSAREFPKLSRRESQWIYVPWYCTLCREIILDEPGQPAVEHEEWESHLVACRVASLSLPTQHINNLLLS